LVVQRDELAAWIRLTETPGVGNKHARKLLAAFGLPQAIFEQSTTALAQVVGPTLATQLCQAPDTAAALTDTTWNWLQQQETDGVHHRVATLGDPLYPAALLNLDDPPLLLYLLGNADFGGGGIDPQTSLAVVGSRNPTPQGAANAHQFAKALSQAGLTIVSGLALGIDGAAHEGALDAAGDTPQAVTVAVVGTGLDRVYPKAHHKLAHRIARHGLLVSEYPLGTPPMNANFPRRNRLIAGLASGTLVVEAALKSGSLITARLASEQGKDVFAIPGSIHAAQARGCHALIKQGAKLVESAQDILEELHWIVPENATNSISESVGRKRATGLFDNNDALLDAIGYDAVGLDALQARTGLATPDLQAKLMALELDGSVSRLPGGLFQRLVT